MPNETMLVSEQSWDILKIFITFLLSLIAGMLIGRYSWRWKMRIAKPRIRFKHVGAGATENGEFITREKRLIVNNISDPVITGYRRFYKISFSNNDKVNDELIVPEEAGYITNKSPGDWGVSKYSSHFLENKKRFIKKIIWKFPFVDPSGRKYCSCASFEKDKSNNFIEKESNYNSHFGINKCRNCIFERGIN